MVHVAYVASYLNLDFVVAFNNGVEEFTELGVRRVTTSINSDA